MVCVHSSIVGRDCSSIWASLAAVPGGTRRPAGGHSRPFRGDQQCNPYQPLENFAGSHSALATVHGFLAESCASFLHEFVWITRQTTTQRKGSAMDGNNMYQDSSSASSWVWTGLKITGKVVGVAGAGHLSTLRSRAVCVVVMCDHGSDAASNTAS